MHGFLFCIYALIEDICLTSSPGLPVAGPGRTVVGPKRGRMNAMTGSDTAGDDRAAWQPDDLIDESATARAEVDPHGIVTGWSEGARRLLGYPSTEIIGRPAASLLAGEPPAETLRSLKTLPRWNGAT